MWCVVEAGTNGDVFKPEFFESKDKAMEYIDNDSKECYATYSDLPDIQIKCCDEEMSAKVWTNEFSFRWQAFEVSHRF